MKNPCSFIGMWHSLDKVRYEAGVEQNFQLASFSSLVLPAGSNPRNNTALSFTGLDIVMLL